MFAPSSLNWTPDTATLSAAVADTVTLPLTVDPAAGAVTATVGAIVSLSTVMVTAAAVVALPAPSVAMAVSTCEPFDAVVESQVTLYGLAASTAPRFAPSSLNCTPVTATLSLAVAETATVLPVTVVPFAGAVIDTVGGATSGALSALISTMNRL